MNDPLALWQLMKIVLSLVLEKINPFLGSFFILFPFENTRKPEDFYYFHTV